MPSPRAFRPALTALLLLAGAGAPPDDALAQGPPATDLFLVEIEERDGTVRAGAVRRLTDRAGYDNQPFFLPDGSSVLYTSIDEAGQADIRLYDLAGGRSRNVTETSPESEYSATPVPGAAIFSVIRVEADSTQRLWAFPRPGAGPSDRPVPDLLLPGVAPVGYHAWLDDHRVALFVLGEPATLRVADLANDRTWLLAWDIGRSMHRLPADAARLLGIRSRDPDPDRAPVRPVSFLQWSREGADGERVGRIKVLDPWTGQIEAVVRAVEGNEHYAWTPSGTLLMGRGPVLYAHRPGRDEGWREVADLSASGVGEITRLAVSSAGTRLVVVSSR